MPQTRFVLSKSLKIGLRPIVVVNKIDRPFATPDKALDLTFDLFTELGATDEQLDFAYCYASGLSGFAVKHINDPRTGMRPLFEPAGRCTSSPSLAERVLAVLEIASFAPLTDQQNALLAEVANIAALALEVLLRNVKTRELLDQVRAAEAKLQTQRVALEAAANAIAIVDRKGTIQWVNQAFTRLTGFEPQEAIGQNPRVLKSGAHPPEFYKQMWQTVTNGSVWHGAAVIDEYEFLSQA